MAGAVATDAPPRITVPARSGAGVPCAMAHDGPHHGIYALPEQVERKVAALGQPNVTVDVVWNPP